MSDELAHGSTGDVMEEIDMTDGPPGLMPLVSPQDNEPLEHPPVIVPSSPNAASLPSPSEIAAQGAARARRSSSLGLTGQRGDIDMSGPRPGSAGSRRSTRRIDTRDSLDRLPIGDRLKRRFTETRVLSTLLVRFEQCSASNY